MIGDINPAWVPPRPALDALRRPLRDNGSGEDFLYMHGRMIAYVNDMLARVGDPSYTRVEGWPRVPPPWAADYPTPEFPESELKEVKSVGYFEHVIAPWEEQFRDPAYLKSVTLGQLGSDIEFTIHNAAHMRWAAPSAVGYRLPTAVSGEIDARWDSPAYDYMGDTYSSHVNPIFWKLHGWISDRVEGWKRAHVIADDFEWRCTWVGPPQRYARAHDARPAAEQSSQDELSRIDRIISSSVTANEFDGFFRSDTARIPALRRRGGGK